MKKREIIINLTDEQYKTIVKMAADSDKADNGIVDLFGFATDMFVKRIGQLEKVEQESQVHLELAPKITTEETYVLLDKKHNLDQKLSVNNLPTQWFSSVITLNNLAGRVAIALLQRLDRFEDGISERGISRMASQLRCTTEELLDSLRLLEKCNLITFEEIDPIESTEWGTFKRYSAKILINKNWLVCERDPCSGCEWRDCWDCKIDLYN